MKVRVTSHLDELNTSLSLVPQSGEERTTFTTGPAPADMTSQNVSFQDKNAAYSYDVETLQDPTREITDSTDAELSNFFSRPIKVASFDWGTGTTLFQDFDPWSLYFENARVINRITNYNLMRAKLRVKAVINGNGFFYGRAIMSYLPFPALDQVSVNRALFPVDVVAASQRPHIYLDPTFSSGGEMTLPFFWAKNNLSIPDQDWRSMGKLNLRSINELKHANGANENVTISIFVWAEDVSLSIPTSLEPGALAPQAGDEYGTGPVSRPASIIARATGALMKAPIIGPYMRATSLAAGTTADIARAFGYSKPNVIDNPCITTIRPVGNLANTNMDDTAVKLSLDCKQELNIDPRTTGVGGQDEMEIKSIAMRESYLTSFPWSTTAGAEDLLFNCQAQPVLWSTFDDEIHMTPAAFAALPFQFWRGSMEFRFQVVSSNYHKGRLAVSYDPRFAETYEYNIQYTHIVDIASDKDFTLRVNWGNEYAYLQNAQPGINSFPYDTDKLTSVNSSFSNGTIAVRVLNELTTPNSSIDNDIQINVFVKACEDFEVAAPTERVNNYTLKPNPTLPLQAQAGDEEMIGDSEDTPEPSAPVSDTLAAEMASTTLDTTGDWIKSIHFGEEVTSIRQLLKRYVLHNVHTLGSAGASFSEMTLPDFPLYKGAVPGAVHTTAAAESYNYVNNTLINYFTPAFAAVRGGMRWKHHRICPVGDNNLLGAVRNPNSNTSYQLRTVIGPGYSSLSECNNWNVNNTESLLQGACETNCIVDPCVEIECPYYSQQRFANARLLDLSSPQFTLNFGTHKVYTTWDGDTPISDTGCDMVRSLVSVGEDYMLSFFLSVPIQYYTPAVPPS